MNKHRNTLQEWVDGGSSPITLDELNDRKQNGAYVTGHHPHHRLAPTLVLALVALVALGGVGVIALQDSESEDNSTTLASPTTEGYDESTIPPSTVPSEASLEMTQAFTEELGRGDAGTTGTLTLPDGQRLSLAFPADHIPPQELRFLPSLPLAPGSVNLDPSVLPGDARELLRASCERRGWACQIGSTDLAKGMTLVSATRAEHSETWLHAIETGPGHYISLDGLTVDEANAAADAVAANVSVEGPLPYVLDLGDLEHEHAGLHFTVRDASDTLLSGMLYAGCDVPHGISVPHGDETVWHCLDGVAQIYLRAADYSQVLPDLAAEVRLLDVS